MSPAPVPCSFPQLPKPAVPKTATPAKVATLLARARPTERMGPGQEQARVVLGALDSLTETTTITYSYDPLSRVTGASYSGTLTNTFAYTYDAVGNRQTQVVDGVTTSYGYDIANRLTSVNGVTYTWDNNGNLLDDGVQTYTYDQANRLKTVTSQQSPVYSFVYNGVGDRLQQSVDGSPTRYVLDPAAGLTQVLSDGTNTYLYGNGRIAQYQAAMQYFGADGLGSVRQLYDASAQVVGSSRYDPYGNVMSQSGATSVFAFPGEQQDATGLTYLRARYYSAAQGRFTTRDVWEGDPNAPMSYNRWVYVRNNPITRTDPTGLIDEGAAAVAADSLVRELRERYGVLVLSDWGYYKIYEPHLTPSGRVIPTTCLWYPGSWELKELWWVKEAVDKTSDKMGGSSKFRTAMNGPVTMVRKPALNFPSPRTWPWPFSMVAGDITLDRIEYSEDYAVYTTIHELGHEWDVRTLERLSTGMSEDLGTTSCSYDNGGRWTCNFDVWALPERPAGTRIDPVTGRPEANAANSRQEDWADAFEDYVNPSHFSNERRSSIGPLRRRYVENKIQSIP